MVGTASNAEYYANIVVEKALSRNLISTCTELATEAYDGEKKTEDLLDDAERRILQLSDTKNRGDFASVGTVVEATLDKITKLYENKAGLTGLPTGFRDLDRMTSGLQPSDLILVAARPSMGKTAFTLNIAQNVASASIRRWPSFPWKCLRNSSSSDCSARLPISIRRNCAQASSTAMKNGRA